MADIAVEVALIVLEGVIHYISNKNPNSNHEEGECDLEETKTWLAQMQNTLRRLENQIDEGTQEVEFYAEQVQGIAYAIEDALDEFLLDMLSHQNMFEKASKRLSTQMNYIVNKKIKTCLVEIPQSSSRSSTWSNQVFPEGDELVDFETHEVKLTQELRQNDQSDRLVIFVVGPGGSGKSSLVHKVYKIFEADKDRKCVHDWVKVAGSQLNSPVQGQVDPTDKLRLLVQQRQFLVVLDDTWRRDDLEMFVNALPNNSAGSRIVITSRNTRVASWLSPKYIHDLSSGLSWEKGKELFCKKAFHDGQDNWPPHLDFWASKILRKCEGMPLAISAIGTFLLEKETPEKWMTLHGSLGSELWREGSDLLGIRSSLQRSYRDLPNHLKSFFLYFSMFPEGYNISREKLIRLWVAERLVKPERGKTDEQVAEEYLIDLVERNLVVTFKDSDGVRVRSCRVLELVRQINISRRKGFITVLEPDYKPSSEKIRRLSAHTGDFNLITGMTSRIRTLLMFGNASSQLEKVLKSSRFLRVLDLEGVPNMVVFPKHVVDLIFLNYLSLRKTKVKKVPKSIKKLVHLETLDLKHTEVTELPEEICQLHKLCHLLVNSSSEDTPPQPQGVKISKAVVKLTAIHKLSLIKVDNIILTALRELKKLRKLGLVDLETKDGKELCTALEQMDQLSTLDVRARDVQQLDLDYIQDKYPLPHLHQLKHLYLRGRLQTLPNWISKLTSIQKIGFQWSNLNLNPLDALQALPILIQLDLLDYYNGEELVFRAGTFKKLMVLNIERFDKLESLEVEDTAMPGLKNLNISKCSRLKLVALPEELIGMLKSENNPRLRSSCTR